MKDAIYERKGRGGSLIRLIPLADDDGADYRLKLDRPGIAGISISFTNTEWDELVAARDKHRDDA